MTGNAPQQEHRLNAQDIVDVLSQEIGEPFKAQWGLGWDQATAERATVGRVNRGQGLVEVVAVKLAEGPGHMIYFGPFSTEAYPTDATMFLFYCSDAIYIVM